MLTRRTDWQARLWEELTRMQPLPFAWGQHDCVLMAAAVVDAMCGSSLYVDVLERYRYDSALSAARVIAAGGGLEKLASAYLGRMVPVGWCHQGDVVLAESEGQQLLCVHDGVKLIAPAPVGLVAVPFNLALLGWKI